MNSKSQRTVTWILIGGILVAVITEANRAPPHTHEQAIECAGFLPLVVNATGFAPSGTGLMAGLQ